MKATATQRKLEKLELIYLRQLTTELHAQLEQAKSNLELAEQTAEFWHRDAMTLQEAIDDENFTTHRAIGITKTGELLVVAH